MNAFKRRIDDKLRDPHLRWCGHIGQQWRNRVNSRRWVKWVTPKTQSKRVDKLTRPPNMRHGQVDSVGFLIPESEQGSSSERNGPPIDWARLQHPPSASAWESDRRPRKSSSPSESGRRRLGDGSASGGRLSRVHSPELRLGGFPRRSRRVPLSSSSTRRVALSCCRRLGFFCGRCCFYSLWREMGVWEGGEMCRIFGRCEGLREWEGLLLPLKQMHAVRIPGMMFFRG